MRYDSSDSYGSHLDESVLWLDIAVKEAVLVHEGDRMHHLEHDIPDLRLLENSTSLSGEYAQQFLTLLVDIYNFPSNPTG